MMSFKFILSWDPATQLVNIISSLMNLTWTKNEVPSESYSLLLAFSQSISSVFFWFSKEWELIVQNRTFWGLIPDFLKISTNEKSNSNPYVDISKSSSSSKLYSVFKLLVVLISSSFLTKMCSTAESPDWIVFKCFCLSLVLREHRSLLPSCM